MGIRSHVRKRRRRGMERFKTEGAPPIALLDVMMPSLSGIEVCRRVRQMPSSVSTYIILLTARTSTDDIVRGLAAGADDYITKPFDTQELRARIQVGLRIVGLQESLTGRVRTRKRARRAKQLDTG